MAGAAPEDGGADAAAWRAPRVMAQRNRREVGCIRRHHLCRVRRGCCNRQLNDDGRLSSGSGDQEEIDAALKAVLDVADAADENGSGGGGVGEGEGGGDDDDDDDDDARKALDWFSSGNIFEGQDDFNL